MNWINIIAVFIGSGMGGACRYLGGKWIQSIIPATAFPFGTFAVNIAGCFIIGILYGLSNRGAMPNPELRLLLTVGFCGGFTTFSTFINENYLLFSAPTSQTLLALAYLTASILVGLIMLYLGYHLT